MRCIARWQQSGRGWCRLGLYIGSSVEPLNCTTGSDMVRFPEELSEFLPWALLYSLFPEKTQIIGLAALKLFWSQDFFMLFKNNERTKMLSFI